MQSYAAQEYSLMVYCLTIFFIQYLIAQKLININGSKVLKTSLKVHEFLLFILLIILAVSIVNDYA